MTFVFGAGVECAGAAWWKEVRFTNLWKPGLEYGLEDLKGCALDTDLPPFCNRPSKAKAVGLGVFDQAPFEGLPLKVARRLPFHSTPPFCNRNGQEKV